MGHVQWTICCGKWHTQTHTLTHTQTTCKCRAAMPWYLSELSNIHVIRHVRIIYLVLLLRHTQSMKKCERATIMVVSHWIKANGRRWNHPSAIAARENALSRNRIHNFRYFAIGDWESWARRNRSQNKQMEFDASRARCAWTLRIDLPIEWKRKLTLIDSTQPHRVPSTLTISWHVRAASAQLH